MSDRANRIGAILAALALVAIGGLGLSLAAGAWGPSAPAKVVGPTLVRWWRDGGWMSFAALAFIGLVLFAGGLALTWAELHHRGLSSLSDFEPSAAGGKPGAPKGRRGETTVRAGPLRRALEADLGAIEGVQHASVVLLGEPGDLEMRARLDIGDRARLVVIGEQLDRVAERLALTVGFGPDVVEVTVALVAEPDQRVV